MKRLITCLSLLAALLMLPVPSHAQDAIQLAKDEVAMQFPGTITFHISAKSSSPIQSIILRYGTNSRSCQVVSGRQPLKFDPANEIDAEWSWDLTRSGALPPGAEIHWQWEINDADQHILQTEDETFVVQDSRHDWKQLSTPDLVFQWYDGSQSFGEELFDISKQSLQRLSKNMGVVPNNRLWVTIYPSADEVREAMIYSPEWTGGVSYPEYNSTLIAIAPYGDDSGKDSIPHELSHLVVGMLMYNCEGISTPTWLEEGLAVYAEGQMTSERMQPVRQALEDNTLPRLSSLSTGFSAYSDEAGLSYTQSGMVVTYLIDKYGPAKMGDLLAAMQKGSEVDEALMKVYGFDTEGLDAAWRTYMGYDPLPTLEPTTSETRVYTPVPTLALWTSAARVTSLPSAATTPTPTATLEEPQETATPIPTLAPPTEEPAYLPVSTPSVSVSSDSNWLLGTFLLSLVCILVLFILLAILIIAVIVRRR